MSHSAAHRPSRSVAAGRQVAQVGVQRDSGRRAVRRPAFLVGPLQEVLVIFGRSEVPDLGELLGTPFDSLPVSWRGPASPLTGWGSTHRVPTKMSGARTTGHCAQPARWITLARNPLKWEEQVST